MTWLSSDLIAAVKRRGQFPDANGALTDPDILALADETMLEDIEPALFVPGSEYGVQTYEVELAKGTAAYRLPARAAVGKLRDLWYLDAAGNEKKLEEAPEERAPRTAGATSSDPSYYYLRGEHVVLLDTPSAAGGRKLRMRYYLRRPRLVEVSATGKVTNINPGTEVVTCDVVPATWTNASLLDFIRYGGLFDHLALDIDPDAVATGASGTITITTAGIPTDLAVGDYVSLSGESSVLCIPVEMHPALTSLTLARCLSAIGDPRADREMQIGLAKLERTAKKLAPRNEGTQAPIIPRNSPLRSGGFGWG